MKTTLMTAVLTTLGILANATPSLARPEVASGDRLLSTNFEGCTARTDRFIETLGIDYDRGSIDRTGYFEDGAFRILCYGIDESQSMVVVFASHDESLDTATSFAQMALEQLSSEEEGSLSATFDVE